MNFLVKKAQFLRKILKIPIIYHDARSVFNFLSRRICMIVVGALSDMTVLNEMVTELSSMGISARIHVDEQANIYYLAVDDEKDFAQAQEYYRVRLGFQKPIEIEPEWIKIKSLPRGELTFGMLVVSVVIFLMSYSNMGRPVYDLLFMGKPETGFMYEIFHGQIWRLVTPIFLHMSILHILFNMLWFKDLGYLIEHHFGRDQLLIFILVSAVISNVLQYLVSGPSFGGMSGVLYAMLGFVWVYKKLNPSFEYGLPKRDIAIMIVWLFLCLTGLLGPIANTAHAGGLFIGMIMAVFKKHEIQKDKLRYVLTAFGILFLTLMIEGLKLDGRYYVRLWF